MICLEQHLPKDILQMLVMDFKEKGLEVDQVWVKLPSVSPFGESKVTLLQSSKGPCAKESSLAALDLECLKQIWPQNPLVP